MVWALASEATERSDRTFMMSDRRECAKGRMIGDLKLKEVVYF